MSRKGYTWLAVFAVVVIGLLIFAQVLKSQGGSTHSQEWKSGYKAGEQMYQGTDYMGTYPVKSPQNIQLVNFCDTSAMGDEPPNLPDYTQWIDGYDAGCYGGTG